MKKWFVNKNFKKIVVGLCLVFALLALVAPTAYALETNEFGNTPKFVGDCESNFGPDIMCGLTLVAHWLILGLLYIIGNFFAMILAAMADVAIWVIGELGIKIVTHSAVSLGFNISLTVANVVFVIAIIIIAFATILRWHEYEAKKMLPKLIITALLVNFSLLAAGLMLDASNVFTTYFLKGDTGNRVSADKIGKAFSPQMFNLQGTYGVTDASSIAGRYDPMIEGDKSDFQKDLGYEKMSKPEFYNFIRNPANRRELQERLNSSNVVRDPDEYEIDISGVWAQFLQILPKVIFAILATFIGMLTVIAICIMALIRNIWVVILLIVMPLAWALRVLPKFEQYWQKWWEKFLNWGVLYLPTLAFFLFLAVETASSTRDQFAGKGTGEGIQGLGRAAGGVTNNWLDDRTGIGALATAPTILESLVLMLIVIGIMIAGLKVAQAMGSGVAGAMANFASKSGRKLAGGLVKASVGIPAVMGGALAGAGLGGLYGVGRAIARPFRKVSVEEAEYRDQIKQFKAAGEDTTQLEKDFKKKFGKPGILSAIKSGTIGGGAAAVGEGVAANLYGRFAGKAATGLTYASAIPIVGGVFGSAAGFLAKSSAAQHGAVDNAMAETKGMSPENMRAWIKAAALKGDAHKAAAMELAHDKDMLDAIPGWALSSYADAIKRYTPGVDRKKIDVLKAAAAHNPLHAEAISGESTKEVAQRLDAGAIQALDEDVYDGIKEHLSSSQRKAYAAKDQNKVLSDTIFSLGSIVDKLPKEMANIAKDFNAAIKQNKDKQKADPALMRQISGHLEKIAGNKTVMKSLTSDELRDLRDGRDLARNTNLRTKSKSEHGAQADASYGLGALLERFARVAAEVGGGRGGGGKAAAPKSGGHGHP